MKLARYCNLLMLLTCFSGSLYAAPVPLSDPENKAGWKLNKEISDEFNGDSLDLDKWLNLGQDSNYYGQWKGRAPSQFNPDNVTIANGFLTITNRWDPDFKFADEKFNNGYYYGKPAPITTAAIITKKKFKYGYMETRAKAADGPVSSAYWTTGKGGEIDVFEHYGENKKKSHSAKKYHTSFHDWRKGSKTFGKRIWTNDHILDFRVADDFHVYGLEWDENYIAIYVDGRLISCQTREEIGDNWVAVNEQKVWIDSETFDWELKPDQMTKEDFGDGQKFVVDYSRIWQREGNGPGCIDRENLINNPSFEANLEHWQGTASTISEDAKAGKLAAQLTSAGRIEQEVKVKPNTTYMLSAWTKSTETNMKNKWFTGYMGVVMDGKKYTDNRYFFPYYHLKSVQFTTTAETKSVTVYFTNKPQGKHFVIDEVKLVEAPKAQ
ncbi:family 16 glycosylhydrolase [Catenovulum maritimum]|uniref:family 16 glycosylhydrolase n=1 Tax=Catenovulum maritimum TaxID=1513271 RepID=UPI00066002BA|nr:family 16 glycosylhydrolase [Catenovulum maritimum]